MVVGSGGWWWVVAGGGWWWWWWWWWVSGGGGEWRWGVEQVVGGGWVGRAGWGCKGFRGRGRGRKERT